MQRRAGGCRQGAPGAAWRGPATAARGTGAWARRMRPGWRHERSRRGPRRPPRGGACIPRPALLAIALSRVPRHSAVRANRLRSRGKSALRSAAIAVFISVFISVLSPFLSCFLILVPARSPPSCFPSFLSIPCPASPLNFLSLPSSHLLSSFSPAMASSPFAT